MKANALAGAVQPVVDTINAAEVLQSRGASLTTGQNGLGTQIRDSAFNVAGASVDESSGPFRSANSLSSTLLAVGGSAGAFSGGSTTLSLFPETKLLRFSQNSASKMFSVEGDFPLQSVQDVAAKLRKGDLTPSDVPVGYVQRGSFNLIDNTRSSIALIEAGVPVNQWNLVNRTGDAFFENAVTTKLSNNGLTNTGTNTLKYNRCYYRCPN